MALICDFELLGIRLSAISAFLQSARLLAAIVAKNAVGSSWRKTMGSREWSRVPSEEKNVVRDQALRFLFSEPSDVVALQLGLLITNIARYAHHQASGPYGVSSLGLEFSSEKRLIHTAMTCYSACGT